MKYLMLLLVLAACGTARTQCATCPNLLIIGDSISIGYTAPLTQNLSRYNVRHIEGNAQNTENTLNKLDQWLAASPNNNTIIWNNGNWDARNDLYGVPIQEYQRNLIDIGRKLVQTRAKVYFVTTCDTLVGNPYYINGQAEQENQVAKQVLPSLGIKIIDLYSFTYGHDDWHIAQGNVHFTDRASMYLADFIGSNL